MKRVHHDNGENIDKGERTPQSKVGAVERFCVSSAMQFDEDEHVDDGADEDDARPELGEHFIVRLLWVLVRSRCNYFSD